ncbi:MAG TPA: haloacid dehalogenase type II [Povalibacter sp.]|nr:haloacid dehalogenase type II [Povalibacter sp.]
MAYDRREFLHLFSTGVVATGLPARQSTAASHQRIKAVVFDAFAILDARPVSALAEALFPGRGSDLSNAWRTRQFEYQWLRALSGRYADFWHTTGEALVFAARMLHLDLDPEKRAQLMQAYLDLRAWSDAAPALASLKQSGLRLAFLSNMTSKMLHSAIDNSGLDGLFDHVLSTERIASYKPDPAAYQMGLEEFRLAREEILFVAFAGWDVAGARWFGYPTFWVNRMDVPAEELGVSADAMGRSLADLVEFLKTRGLVR